MARDENVIFLGPPGVGKTHLAVGLAMKAITAGMTVYYASLAKLIADLKKQMIRAGWNGVGVSTPARIF